MGSAAAKILKVASPGLIDYEAGLRIQESIVNLRTSGALSDDVMLLLEHPHVFTLGRGADARFIVTPVPGVPVHRVSRGGQVTYHGPGQLVGYPILKLEGRDRDVHVYLRRIEAAIVAALASFGIAGEMRNGLTGVWASERKIASIGVGIRRWVTMHGFAVNISPDLNYFHAIVPCGIAGCEVTSAAALGYAEVGVEAFGDAMGTAFAEVFGYDRVERIELARLTSIAGAPARASAIGSQL